MMIHEITVQAGRYKARKRVGRGRGSGVGKTSGRGHNGAAARAGYSRRHAFEGGQMPFFRRMAKRGFKNTNFTVEFWTVNIGEILAHHDFKSGGKVDTDSLVKAQLVRDNTRPVKILGDMRGLDKVGVKLDVEVARVTDSVRAKITEAGGSINEIGTRRDEIRGVDRNTEDRKPTKLTKKLRRTSTKK